MYKFIKRDYPEHRVTEKDIHEVEKTWGFQFPPVLRDFYLKHNDADIYSCYMEWDDGFECGMAQFYPLKYGDCPVEEVISMHRENEFFPKNLIPIGYEGGGNDFCWDQETGEVYFCNYEACDDPLEPDYICESVEELFRLMEESCDKKA